MSQSFSTFQKLVQALDRVYELTKNDDLGMLLGTLDPPTYDAWPMDESITQQWHVLFNKHTDESRKTNLTSYNQLSEDFILYLVKEFNLNFSTIMKQISEEVAKEFS